VSRFWFLPVLACLAGFASAAIAAETPFKPLEEELWPPTSEVRLPSGAPGPAYWQQKVDYDIQVAVDEAHRSLKGRVRVTYRNNSPHTLDHLWLSLDQNSHKPESTWRRSLTSASRADLGPQDLRREERFETWSGGFDIQAVRTVDGLALTPVVVDTLMRIDPPLALAPGASFIFDIAWTLPLIEPSLTGSRGGWECFDQPSGSEDCAFYAAQWFPRVAAYTDYGGWGVLPFLEEGEISSDYGDYRVAATGVLTNPGAVLSSAQQARLAAARTSDKIVRVVTPAEADPPARASGARTWVFEAVNVRDFAFASSRRFIWDAMAIRQADPSNPLVLAMAFYPKEARPLWDRYAVKTIAHALSVGGDLAFPYPYPVLQAVDGPVDGMEFPMLVFDAWRPTRHPDGALTYSEADKVEALALFQHEALHQWLPMTVNSDERRWAWLDEGVTSFLELQAIRRFDPQAPLPAGGRFHGTVPAETSFSPSMGRADALNAYVLASYTRPALALSILRETVLGPERFDDALRRFMVRWRFKRPTPADFFRSMEDSAGTDLDWFWRGWFYTDAKVDIAVEDVVRLDPSAESTPSRPESQAPLMIGADRTSVAAVDRDPDLKDFYSAKDPVRPRDDATGRPSGRGLDLYRITLGNLGGLVSVVPLRLVYGDGSEELVRLPAELWRKNPRTAIWTLATRKTLVEVVVDPRSEIGDVNRANNSFGGQIRLLATVVDEVERPDDRMRAQGFSVSPESAVARWRGADRK